MRLTQEFIKKRRSNGISKQGIKSRKVMRKTAAHETLALVSRPPSALPVGEQQTTNVRGAGDTRSMEVGRIAIHLDKRTNSPARKRKKDAQLQTQESNGVLCSNRSANDGCAESPNHRVAERGCRLFSSFPFPIFLNSPLFGGRLTCQTGESRFVFFPVSSLEFAIISPKFCARRGKVCTPEQEGAVLLLVRRPGGQRRKAPTGEVPCCVYFGLWRQPFFLRLGSLGARTHGRTTRLPDLRLLLPRLPHPHGCKLQPIRSCGWPFGFANGSRRPENPGYQLPTEANLWGGSASSISSTLSTYT